MNENKNKPFRVFLITIGIIGIMAGIFIALNGNKIMGIGGLIASAGITLKGIYDIKKEKN